MRDPASGSRCCFGLDAGDLDIVSHAWDAWKDLHLWRADRVAP